MKQTKTVTKAIKLIYDLYEKISRLDNIVKERYSGKFTVSFYHDADRNLLTTRWSDKFYGYDQSFTDIQKKTKYVYVYSICSDGIHFESYSQCVYNSHWLEDINFWGKDGANMPLRCVPNTAPPGCLTGMYIFHQEQIRETLSGLPAWAIVCLDN